MRNLEDVASGRAQVTAPRTYRRACRPLNDSSDFCDDLGSLYGEHIVATSKIHFLISPGAAMTAIRSPGGVIEPVPMSLCRRRTYSRSPQRLEATREFSTNLVQRMLASM